jgi:hypothetical protein
MLQQNVSLESLSVSCGFIKTIKAEECFVLVTALQYNITLKTSKFCEHGILHLNDDEDKQIAALVLRKILRIGKSTRSWWGERCQRHLAT